MCSRGFDLAEAHFFSGPHNTTEAMGLILWYMPYPLVLLCVRTLLLSYYTHRNSPQLRETSSPTLLERYSLSYGARAPITLVVTWSHIEFDSDGMRVVA